MNSQQRNQERIKAFLRSLTLNEMADLAKSIEEDREKTAERDTDLKKKHMYDDVVIDQETRKIIYTGTTLETIEWLKERPSAIAYDVIIGKTSEQIPVSRYLYEDRVKNVRELVRMAMARQEICTRHGDQSPADRFLDEITTQIIELF